MATEEQTETTVSEDVQAEASPQTGHVFGSTRKDLLVLTVVSAVAAALVCVSIATARQGWRNWRLELVLMDLGAALVGSFVANLFKGLDERGTAWASTYVSPNAPRGRVLHHVLSVLPGVAVRAAVMTACLAAVNATAVQALVFREEISMPVLAIPIRFLADIPQVFAVCLLVRLLAERYAQRR